MKRFFYKVCDEEFNINKGYIEEDSIETVKEQIILKGYKIIDIKEKPQCKLLKNDRLKEESLVNFCGQLAIVINTGVNIIRGLEIIKEQDKKLEKVTERILIGVKKGKSLGIAMEETEMFPKLLTDMVNSGELSGNVEEVLFNMEEFYQRETNIKSKVKSASIYPCILLILTVVLMGIFNFFVFSRLMEIFEDNDGLPKITLILLDMINYFNNNIVLIIFSIILFIFILKHIFKIDKVKYIWDKLILNIPVIGEFKKNVIIDRFSRSMGIFVRSAIPIIDAIDNVQYIVGNTFIGKKINKCRMEIINGNKIADTFENEGAFDSLTIQLMRIGEETGSLESMFFKLANIYDKKVEKNMNNMMALIEPMFILIIGILVGVVIIALALPILQISNNVK
ncbi:type II secretion system F family protein [Clostridium rectalis]|uniref:type II secretion system F family protein n=1 Tax=Clostridium rectalis TaxID=2040295 RepID=UPI000F63D4FD|nr:type II secretion system F family protein [Clostridium rectalis]